MSLYRYSWIVSLISSGLTHKKQAVLGDGVCMRRWAIQQAVLARKNARKRRKNHILPNSVRCRTYGTFHYYYIYSVNFSLIGKAIIFYFSPSSTNITSYTGTWRRKMYFILKKRLLRWDDNESISDDLFHVVFLFIFKVWRDTLPWHQIPPIPSRWPINKVYPVLTYPRQEFIYV